MKRKTVFYLVAVTIVLLALYGVWHFSPLRYLTRSKSQADQMQTTTFKRRNQPIVVTKKIFPESETKEQTSDIPHPLIVLKDQSPKPASQPAAPRTKSADQSGKSKKRLVLEPDGSLIVQKNKSAEVKPDASAPAIPDKPPAESLKSKSYHPYSILLSSCKLPQSARKVVSDYRKLGLKPYIVKVKLEKGDEWLRVLAGHYQTRQEALKIKKDHQLSKALVKKTPFTNLIGTFSAKEDMKPTLGRLKKLGYSPYFLKTADGKFKLVVGAFITKEGAEYQKKELQSKGIQNQVIHR